MADTKKPIEEVSVEDAQAMFANAAKALGGSQGRSAGFRRVSIPVSEPVRPAPLPKEEPKVEATVEETVEERFVEPVRPAEPAAPEKPQSKRKAWYLKKRKEEEEESLPISKDKLRERRAAREAAEEAEVIAAAAAAPVVEELAEDEDIRIAESRPSSVSAEDDYDDYDDRFDFGATTVIPSAVVFDYYDDDEYDDDDYEPTNEELEEEVAFSALEQALNRHKEVYGDTRKGRRNRYHDYGFGMGISFDGPDYEDDEDY
ncbi:MAG: hypothetical protein IJ241_02635 [Clostridia bacterium]|nr:hypothetical protein [Clostridia bacterium]MBQ8925858.1 hypothetical protein [Clostridia bacterium]